MKKPVFDKIVRIAIGIQARSTSKRLPNKVSESISEKPVVMRVVDAAKDAARYLNSSNKQVYLSTSLLIPNGDPLSQTTKSYVEVIECPGAENDVLTRYASLQKVKNSDYVVRVTADCPMIPPFVISKLSMLAVVNGYDYISNVDERFRTSPDGFDCEVISKRLLAYLDSTAKSLVDREHVTTLLRRDPPNWALIGFQINFLDMSDKKLSIDTRNDLEHVREEYAKVERKLTLARAFFGKMHVHQF